MAATKNTPTQLQVLNDTFAMKSATKRGFSIDDLVNRVKKATGNGNPAGIKRLVGRVRKNLEAEGLTITQKDNGRYVVTELTNGS